MKRRKLLIGASGVTASALAIGTGAFSAARVERTASIAVTTDADGLVGLVPNPDVAGVKMNSSQLTIDLEDPGVNVNSVYQFGLFEGDLGNDYPENFPFKAEQDEPAEDLSDGRDGDPFKSAFAVVNQSSSEKRIQFALDIDEVDVEDTTFAFEIHRKRQQRGLIESGPGNKTVDHVLGPGEAFGVSFIIDAGEDALGDQLEGSIEVNAEATQ